MVAVLLLREEEVDMEVEVGEELATMAREGNFKIDRKE